jgi:hypothetical protein
VECIGTDDTLEKQITLAPEDTEPDRGEPMHEELLSKLAAATGMKVVEEAAQGGKQVLEACALIRDKPTEDPEDNTKVRTGPKAPPGSPAPECADSTGAQEWTVYGLGGVLLLALMVMALR